MRQPVTSITRLLLAVALLLVASLPPATPGVQAAPLLNGAGTPVMPGNVPAAPWTPAGNPYVVSGDVLGYDYVIEPGVIVKFMPDSRLNLYGSNITAIGTSDAPIIFTSYRDDIGGDTNGDGDATQPAAGDWMCICINGTGIFEHVEVRYAGQTIPAWDGVGWGGYAASISPHYPSIYGAVAASLSLKHVKVSHGAIGVHALSDSNASRRVSVSITDSLIQHMSHSGVLLGGQNGVGHDLVMSQTVIAQSNTGINAKAATIDIFASQITENTTGIVTSDTSGSIRHTAIRNNVVGFSYTGPRNANPSITLDQNEISGNDSYAISASSLNAVAIDATNTWWGHVSGPYHPDLNDGGLGNAVSDKVSFVPWSNYPTQSYDDEIRVPSGAFQMGCDALDASCHDSNQQPAHSVYLNEFYIDRFEVTNARYRACVAAGYCTPPTSADTGLRPDYYTEPVYSYYPVVNVNWGQAKQFCLWDGKRLPTEAEWEYAARGTDARLYPWGNQDPTCDLANGVVSGNNCGPGDTTAVGSYPAGASPFGLLDLAGNVWEWTADWYAPDYYAATSSINPTGPISGTERVIRGGSWTHDAYFMRSTFRGFSSPDTGDNQIGFRCARSGNEYTIEPIWPDSHQTDSIVMATGTAYRYFRLYDKDGNPAPGALVHFSAPNDPTSRASTATTDTDGFFSWNGIYNGPNAAIRFTVNRVEQAELSTPLSSGPTWTLKTRPQMVSHSWGFGIERNVAFAGDVGTSLNLGGDDGFSVELEESCQVSERFITWSSSSGASSKAGWTDVLQPFDTHISKKVVSRYQQSFTTRLADVDSPDVRQTQGILMMYGLSSMASSLVTPLAPFLQAAQNRANQQMGLVPIDMIDQAVGIGFEYEATSFPREIGIPLAPGIQFTIVEFDLGSVAAEGLLSLGQRSYTDRTSGILEFSSKLKAALLDTSGLLPSFLSMVSAQAADRFGVPNLEFYSLLIPSAEEWNTVHIEVSLDQNADLGEIVFTLSTRKKVPNAFDGVYTTAKQVFTVKPEYLHAGILDNNAYLAALMSFALSTHLSNFVVSPDLALQLLADILLAGIQVDYQLFLGDAVNQPLPISIELGANEITALKAELTIDAAQYHRSYLALQGVNSNGRFFLTNSYDIQHCMLEPTRTYGVLMRDASLGFASIFNEIVRVTSGYVEEQVRSAISALDTDGRQIGALSLEFDQPQSALNYTDMVSANSANTTEYAITAWDPNSTNPANELGLSTEELRVSGQNIAVSGVYHISLLSEVPDLTARVALTYTEAAMEGRNENLLRIVQWTPQLSGWSPVEAEHDPDANQLSGRVQVPATLAIAYDDTSPVIEIQSVLSATNAGPKVAYSLVSQDDGVGLKGAYYSLDQMNFIPYTDTVRFALPAPAIYAYAEDLVGNRSPSTVHQVAPSSLGLTAPSEPIFVNSPTLLAASVLPITTTTPLTLVWAIEDSPPVTVTDRLTATLPFSSAVPGAYTVTVTALNDRGSVAVQHVVTVVDVPIQGLTVTAPPTSTVGTTVQFHAAILAGTNVTYTWDLGDGNTASGLSPLHTYADPGSYSVTVTARNQSGSVTATSNLQVHDLPTPTPVTPAPETPTPEPPTSETPAPPPPTPVPPTPETPTPAVTPTVETPTPEATPMPATPTPQPSPPPHNAIPMDGGTVDATVGNLQITLTMPPGALSQPIVVRIFPVDAPPSTGDFRLLGQVFAIEAVTYDNIPVTHFTRPFRLILRYSDGSVAGMDEARLSLHHWNEESTEWDALATEVDSENNLLVVDLDHLSLFVIAVRDDPVPNTIFLPALNR